MVDLADVALDFREYQGRNLRIATKYPNLARQFLYRNNIHHFTLVQAEGAVEAAPMLGYADIIIDLTQTGTTLRENQLKIVNDGIIVDSQACLIGNRKLLTHHANSLNVVRQLLEYIDAAQLGRSYHQITANIRGASAETVALLVASHPLTRGLQGPTVAPIYGGQENARTAERWFTVTIMVPSDSLLAAVDYLRSIGGTQTIVSPLRYVFLEESPTFRDLTNNLKDA
jgi:ATP phosphoribosyltransferase